MRFEIQDFRRFHNPNHAEIAPLTVLVGENSSGKTSLLAGLRYIFQAISVGTEASFNREPFFLGSYDQIAHYRGGRYGRSSEFSISLKVDENDISKLNPENQGYFFTSKKNNIETSFTTITLRFGNEQSQPILNTVILENKYVVLKLKRGDLPNFSITRKDTNKELNVNAKGKFSFFAPAPSTVNRNSLGPFFQTVQGWVFSHRFSRVEKEKISKNELDFMELFLKAIMPTYTFADTIVYASAPFRTKPERTYSPIEASSSAEGSHIPILLAQVKAYEKSKWNAIKTRLEFFGNQSGMFKKIDIKRLGTSNSDPFQIIVTVSKDKSNIIDVGYGISQILPLIVETMINDNAKIFIFQQPEVHLHPKAQAELGSFFVDFALKSEKFLILESHSDYIIDRIKSELMSRQLPLSKYLSVLFFDKDDIETNIRRINFDNDGTPIDPPENYRKFFLSESIKTMGL